MNMDTKFLSLPDTLIRQKTHIKHIMAAFHKLTHSINTILLLLSWVSQAQVECEGASETACKNLYDPVTGDPYCAWNNVELFCYSVTRAIGSKGVGSFDDGYANAEQEADASAQTMQTMITVFAVLIGLLIVLGIALGVYFYRKSQQEDDKDGGYNVPKQQSEKAFGSPASNGTHKKVDYVDEGDDDLDL